MHQHSCTCDPRSCSRPSAHPSRQTSPPVRLTFALTCRIGALPFRALATSISAGRCPQRHDHECGGSIALSVLGSDDRIEEGRDGHHKRCDPTTTHVTFGNRKGKVERSGLSFGVHGLIQRRNRRSSDASRRLSRKTLVHLNALHALAHDGLWSTSMASQSDVLSPANAGTWWEEGPRGKGRQLLNATPMGVLILVERPTIGKQDTHSSWGNTIRFRISRRSRSVQKSPKSSVWVSLPQSIRKKASCLRISMGPILNESPTKNGQRSARRGTCPHAEEVGLANPISCINCMPRFRVSPLEDVLRLPNTFGANSGSCR